MQCQMFISISGLYSPDASDFPITQYDGQRCLQIAPKVLCGGAGGGWEGDWEKSPLVENTDLGGVSMPGP